MSTSKEYIPSQHKSASSNALNAETQGIWNGWSLIGDKEVAREAATKGTHLQLVLAFLGARKNLTEKETLEWFNQEILCWVSELLIRKQIFKASHILTNINLDPIHEITKVFINCIEEDLRAYLGNHLIKIDKINESLKENWLLLKKIIENPEIWEEAEKDEDSKLNIAFVNDMTLQEKQIIAANVYIKTLDDEIVFLLVPSYLWTSLLKSDNIILLIAWVNCFYSQTFDENISKSINNIFMKFPIDQNMISCAYKSQISEINKTLILNELCKYGIFNDCEKNSVTDIVNRICDIKQISNFINILTKDSSNVDITYFYRLLVMHCLENSIYDLLGFCVDNNYFVDDFRHEVNSKFLNSVTNMKKVFNNPSDSELLRENIFDIAQLVSDDKDIYFKENPIILLALIILSNNTDILRVLNDSCVISIPNFNIPINVILDKYPLIHNVVKKFKVTSYRTDMTIYDLLEKYHKFNIREIFKFRFSDDFDLPNFNCPVLVQKYGFNKRIKFLTYIKHGRPVMASVFYNTNRLNVNYTMSKVHNLAFRNFSSPLIVGSCIVFIEMIGESSEFLRCHISAAKIILTSKLEEEANLIHMLVHISKQHETFLVQLETSVIQQINFTAKLSGAELVTAMRLYSIVVRFTLLHNLPLPLQFLECCARNNHWLPFLMHLQKYNYSVEIAQRAIQHCKDECLLEHLQHCLLYDIQLEKRKTPKSRDSRSFYLSRIGMRKNVKEDVQVTSTEGLLQSSITSQSSYGSATSSSGLSDFIESETLDLKTSLLQTIIKCHNSTDPPRALLQACQYYSYPLFAILATSYEPDSVVKNWLTWLTVSCDIHKQFVIYDKVTTSANLVTDILHTSVKNGYCGTLEQSLHIFLPENPIKAFVVFLNECSKLHFDQSLLKESLSAFKTKVKFKRSNSIIAENDHEMTYLNNKLWIENTSIILLATLLQFNLNSKYEQIKTLELLHLIGFKEHFARTVPDFFKLLQTVNTLVKSPVTLDFTAIYDNNLYRKEISRILDELVAIDSFEEALIIAKIENHEIDGILIKKLKHQRTKKTANFWEHCNEEFIKHKISPQDAVDFFLAFNKESSDCDEQLELLKLAQHWAAQYDLDNLFGIERNLWITYFKRPEIPDIFQLNTTYTYLTYTDMLYKLDLHPNAPINLENSLTESQFESALTELLNVGDVFQALRFERMFGYKNTDLEIVKLCMSVAEGLVLPYQLSAEQRMLIMKGSNAMSLNHRRRAFLSTRLSSMSSSSHSPHGQRPSPLSEPLLLNTSVQDAIAILECLTDRLRAGAEFAQRVLMLYRISVNIDREYKAIIDVKGTECSFALLRSALAEDCRNKLEVVHDCVQVYKWTREQISDFLCEEIITSLTAQVRSKSDTYILWDLYMDADFQMILQLLLDNCTMLGHKLYSYASAIQHSETSSSLNFRQEEFSLVIELLIRAHDCYTADCNMEGISVILKKCRTLIGFMLTKECWKLIVRLLTGVARYTEMNYVFQILRENDQFEFLLRKGSRKDNGLKLALLEYLKKYCPENRELYRMVALHFTLFSEVAELWENEADGIIRNLIAISKLEMQNQKINPDTEPFIIFTNTDGTKLCLNKAMINYTHSAEYHLQGEKLSKAMKAAKQAELLALQLSLLKNVATNGTTICLLHLTREQINRILSMELNFPQCLILIEAYSHNADWATILFKQFIVDNKQAYFDGFLRTFPLTDTLVHNLSRRYLSDRNIPETSVTNMKTVLRNVSSVRVQYKIASELVFTDILEDLLAGDQLAHLKDTVWKKGYKE